MNSFKFGLNLYSKKLKKTENILHDLRSSFWVSYFVYTCMLRQYIYNTYTYNICTSWSPMSTHHLCTQHVPGQCPRDVRIWWGGGGGCRAGGITMTFPPIPPPPNSPILISDHSFLATLSPRTRVRPADPAAAAAARPAAATAGPSAWSAPG